jgi:hypothetical protein
LAKQKHVKPPVDNSILKIDESSRKESTDTDPERVDFFKKELMDRVDELEKENASLKLQLKQQSNQPPIPAASNANNAELERLRRENKEQGKALIKKDSILKNRDDELKSLKNARVKADKDLLTLKQNHQNELDKQEKKHNNFVGEVSLKSITRVPRSHHFHFQQTEQI